MIRDVLDVVKFVKETFLRGPRIRLSRAECFSFKYPPGSNSKYVDPDNHWATYSVSYTLENKGEGTDVTENILVIVDPSTDEKVAILPGNVAINTGGIFPNTGLKAVGKNESRDFWFSVDQRWSSNVFEGFKHELRVKFVGHDPIVVDLGVKFKSP